MGVDPVAEFAAEFGGLWRTRRLERVSTEAIDSLSLEQAYAVQALVVAGRTAAGERPVGYKIGCTSRAIRAQFGLSSPVHGRLMAPHVHPSGREFSLAGLPHAAVEPEYAFAVERQLAGEPNLDEVRAALRGPIPGVEIHDYRFSYGEPTSQELVASNALHIALVLADTGGVGAPPAGELAGEPIELVVNGELVDSGVGADIFDAGPYESVAWLVAQLAAVDRALESGELVIPGSAVALRRVGAGDRVEARFGRFGTCRVDFVA